jgi:hypothetical protein
VVRRKRDKLDASAGEEHIASVPKAVRIAVLVNPANIGSTAAVRA